MSELVTAAFILDALRAHHSEQVGGAPAWVCFEELRVGTGYAYGSDRRIDFFALHTWPSKGYRAVAYEVKVSRSDFQRELERPAKRASYEQYAGECWYATPPGLLRPDEIPEGWGLIEVDDQARLRRRKLASQRQVKELPIAFVAAVARRVHQAAGDPPARPPLLYRYAGEEVDDTQLLDIARDVLKRRVEEEQKAARKLGRAEGREELLAAEGVPALRALQRAVMQHCGHYGGTAEGFALWASAHRSPARGRLSLMRGQLDQAVNALALVQQSLSQWDVPAPAAGEDGAS